MFVNTDEVQIGSQGGGGQALGLAQMPPAPPTTVAVIESIATGTPSRVVDQSEAADQIAALFSNPEQRERISRLYRKTMIGTRRMAVDPLDPEFDAMRRKAGTIQDRMNLFYRHAVPLAVDVAGRALAPIEDPATEIGLLVFVTSTGFIAPGVDVAIVKQLGLSPSVSRVVAIVLALYVWRAPVMAADLGADTLDAFNRYVCFIGRQIARPLWACLFSRHRS